MVFSNTGGYVVCVNGLVMLVLCAWFSSSVFGMDLQSPTAEEIFHQAQKKFADAKSWSYEIRSKNHSVLTRTIARRNPDGFLDSRRETIVFPAPETAAIMKHAKTKVLLELETGNWLLYPAVKVAVKIPMLKEESQDLILGKTSVELRDYNLINRAGDIQQKYARHKLHGRQYYEIFLEPSALVSKQFAASLAASLAAKPKRDGTKFSQPEIDAMLPGLISYLFDGDDFTLYEYREYNNDGRLSRRRAYHCMVLDKTIEPGTFFVPDDYSRFYPEAGNQLGQLLKRFDFLLDAKIQHETTTTTNHEKT
jgi:hypothetical protein